LRARSVVVASLLAGLPLAAWAGEEAAPKEKVNRCRDKDITVTQVIPASVAVYGPDGKYATDMPATTIGTGAPVVDCDEDYGLMEVKLATGQTVWLDRADLKLRIGEEEQSRQVCVQAASNRPTDKVVAAVSGIKGKKPTDCVPAPATGKPAR
jgi:hypothetical protein